MEQNDQYLRDFISEREEILKFENECHSIAEKASILAQENISKFEAITKGMEEQ